MKSLLVLAKKSLSEMAFYIYLKYIIMSEISKQVIPFQVFCYSIRYTVAVRFAWDEGRGRMNFVMGWFKSLTGRFFGAC